MRISIIVIFFVFLCGFINPFKAQEITPSDHPNPTQEEMQKRKYGMFIHFGINTFGETEWSDGTIPAERYNPEDLDCDQWIRVAKEAGFRYVLLTVKHHDGFCLWDSRYTDYDVASSPVKTDVVRAVSDACKKYGLQFAIYYSLWDRHEPAYTSKDFNEYIDYMCKQLDELFTNYGPICELWLDGGWDKEVDEWQLPKIYSLVKGYNPTCAVSVNHTIVLKENERKFALPDSMIVDNKYYFQYFPSDFRLWDPKIAHKMDKKQYLHQGKSYYLPFEHTLCISKAWNWFQKREPSPVRDLDELEELFYWCTDNDNTLVINVAPDQKGKIREHEANTIIQLGKRMGIQQDKPLPRNGKFLSLQARTEASSVYRDDEKSYDASLATDGGMQTCWMSADTTATLTVHINADEPFNKISLFECCDVENSEDGFSNKRKNRIQSYRIEIWENNEWKSIYVSDEPMGDCKVIKFPCAYKTSSVRLNVLKASAPPAIYEFNVINQPFCQVPPRFTCQDVRPEMVDVNAPGEGPKQSAEVVRRLEEKVSRLPVYDALLSERAPFDWLLTPEKVKAGIYRSEDGKSIVVANALVSRTFRIMPNLATVDYTNRMLGESLLRAVSSEGAVWIDGKKWQLGGLAGQPERGYLRTEWVDTMQTVPESFLVEDFEVKPIEEVFHWARSRWALNKKAPTGKEIVFTMRGDKELKGVSVKLHVAVYDEIPVICKWFEVGNDSALPINVDHFQVEDLAFAEPESPSGGDPSTFLLPNIHVESDYNCKGSFTEKETDITEHWVEDPEYTSQRNYPMQTPCVLQVAPPIGPDQQVEPGGVFRSFRVYEMPFDSFDRERKGLFTRRFYRTVAPWTTENPIFMHLTSSEPDVVRRAVDQCAETGYEMIILSFGSGADAEDISEENIAKFKALVDYAKSKGIEMGCYSLLASRWISDEVDVINPKTGKRGGMTFGSSPCLCSDWGYEYFRKIKTFFEQTGMTCFEHDGSYPGDVCASTKHTHHKGLEDSQWNQFHKITELYHWMCENGIYLNVPDFYFLNGSTKTSIGYREVNWSLPRDRQLIHTRQLNYDCTWERIPSSLWSFVPLVEYHGGGAAATLEPLSEHLYEYKTLMFQNYGAGIQACYRGPRLYDTEETKKAVQEIVSWYKKYRRILNSDIIHLRKPDARDWDGIMHVNPQEKEKALAMFFNPTDEDITRIISLPLYYTGLKGKAGIREQERPAQTYVLDGNGNVTLKVKIPARGYTWYVVE